MGKRGIIRRAAHAVALLAVALFSLASIQSIQMQASMASPVMSLPMCGSKAIDRSTHKRKAPHQKAHVTCEFCAAAGHAPVHASVVAVFSTSTAVWASYAVLRPLGPRGPPSITPKSRGPPLAALTV